MLAAAVAALALVAGCGGEDQPAQTDLRALAKRAIVTPTQIERAEADSPERAVLSWWRLTQFRSPAAIGLFTPEARKKLEDAGYAQLSYRYLGPWLATVRPKFDEVRIRGNSANAFVRLVGPPYISPTNASLTLRRVADDWLLTDPTFMLEQALILAEQEAAAARAREPSPAP